MTMKSISYLPLHPGQASLGFSCPPGPEWEGVGKESHLSQQMCSKHQNSLSSVKKKRNRADGGDFHIEITERRGSWNPSEQRGLEKKVTGKK